MILDLPLHPFSAGESDLMSHPPPTPTLGVEAEQRCWWQCCMASAGGALLTGAVLGHIVFGSNDILASP